MAKITMNDYLNQFGLGESAGYNRKRATKVAPKAFNPIAYAEAYAYVIQDGKRMKISANNLRKKCNALAAAGEKTGIIDAVKEGARKVKDFLIKLYEKAIKFFTETLRYWMSNERKVAKVVAELKTRKELNLPEDDNEKKVTFKLNSEIANLTGITEGTMEKSTERGSEKKWSTYLIRGIKNSKLVDYLGEDEKEFPNFMGRIYASVNEAIEDSGDAGNTTEDVDAQSKKAFEDIDEAIADFVKIFTEGKDEKVEVKPKYLNIHYKVIVAGLIETLEKISSKDGKNMKAIFADIEKLKKELKDLKDPKKDKENPTEAETLEYQRKRRVIQLKIKWANNFNGVRDKMIGRLISFANQLLAQGKKAKA